MFFGVLSDTGIFSVQVIQPKPPVCSSSVSDTTHASSALRLSSDHAETLAFAEAASKYADYSIITSDNPDYEDPDAIITDILNYFDKNKIYTTIADREEAIRHAVRIAYPGDIVLFAGKGHETYQLIRGEKVPFSERAIILDEALAIERVLI